MARQRTSGCNSGAALLAPQAAKISAPPAPNTISTSASGSARAARLTSASSTAKAAMASTIQAIPRRLACGCRDPVTGGDRNEGAFDDMSAGFCGAPAPKREIS